ncbi:hypothetical protein ATO12_08145 [Aquimarina atlantica]|uniref:AB hydrolase-1 domain-containing protein n=1 Tax=Aquimarina atlantica TaxID=1317122 RepID=A0A023BMQ7_9FLAO|nr:alpha/beta hydrolase [Aquimarina atlantica]EZH71350.1 hypothetical protein ATO12_08145 [Aquimarina atlantica]
MKVVKKILKWLGYLILLCITVFITLTLIPEKEIITAIKARDNTQFWNMEKGFKIAYHYLPSRKLYNSSENKAPVVFLHGGPGGYVHSSIIKTLDQLTELGHEVYLYDQRGSGLSDRLEKFTDVTFKSHVEDLNEIITQKINKGKVILIGQSFGCNIIVSYSSKYPKTIDRIVFSAPGQISPPLVVNKKYIDLDSIYKVPDSLNFIEPYNFNNDVNKVAFKPKALTATTGALLLDKKLVSDKQMDRVLNTLASKFTKGMVCDTKNVLPEEGGGGFYAFMATNNDDDIDPIREKIKKLKTPIIVLQGQCDYIPYSVAFEYVALYQNSQYFFIKNAGHEIWWEQPEEFIKIIKNFID